MSAGREAETRLREESFRSADTKRRKRKKQKRHAIRTAAAAARSAALLIEDIRGLAVSMTEGQPMPRSHIGSGGRKIRGRAFLRQLSRDLAHLCVSEGRLLRRNACQDRCGRRSGNPAHERKFPPPRRKKKSKKKTFFYCLHQELQQLFLSRRAVAALPKKPIVSSPYKGDPLSQETRQASPHKWQSPA